MAEEDVPERKRVKIPKAIKAAAKTVHVHNYYQEVKNDGPVYRNKNKLAPQHPARILIVGSAGAGKTNFLCNLLDKCGNYDQILIFCRNLDQPLYNMLQERNNVIASNTLEDLPDPDELPDTDDTQRICVFDDFQTASKQDHALIVDYFVRARSKNCSAVYITQSYVACPKDIRLQCNYVFIKGVNSSNTLNWIMKDFAVDVPPKRLADMYRNATKHGEFLQLDLVTKDPKMMYRRGFGLGYVP